MDSDAHLTCNPEVTGRHPPPFCLSDNVSVSGFLSPKTYFPKTTEILLHQQLPACLENGPPINLYYQIPHEVGKFCLDRSLYPLYNWTATFKLHIRKPHRLYYKASRPRFLYKVVLGPGIQHSKSAVQNDKTGYLCAMRSI